ncbi:MAG: hypothetical protein JOY91_01025 [Sinobacteraceae bacterium]|nr:hypothetical protein [Nevskiaceae bacterium]
MTTLSRGSLAALCITATMLLIPALASAQSNEVKEKPPLYTYVANWAIPRAKWTEMAKDTAPTVKILDHDIANGTLVAYGNDESLLHTPDGATHSGWWCAMSMAAVLNTLDEFYKSGSSTNAVLASATRHWDDLYVSRSYGWHPGSVKGGYVHGSVYKLKADAPNDAIEILSKSFITPMFEKLLGDGTVQAYQIAEQASHAADPGLFYVFYVTPKAEGLDKVNAALGEAIKGNALAGPAFGSMVDFSQHRDELARGDSVFK